MLQRSQLGLICIGETPEGETCLVPGTKILLNDGQLRNIEKLQLGDLVYSTNHQPSLVIRITTFASRDVGELCTSNYSLVCTPDHKVLTKQGFVMAEQAKEVYTIDGWQAVQYQPAGKSTVYYITLGGHQSFFANGIAVHNCGLVKNLAVTSKISFDLPGSTAEGLSRKPRPSLQLHS